MKSKASTALCVLLAAALMIAAVALGAYRGWSGERSQVAESFSGNQELRVYLDERAMDAANLSVVAARHLPREDARLTTLSRVRKTLNDSAAAVNELTAADAELTRTAQTLQQELPLLASVQSSTRDQAYITTLTRTLLSARDLAESYNDQVTSFNARLRSSPTGMLAQLLGVTPLAAYDAP